MILDSFPLHSRVHSMQEISSLYVKREDELGFGISGSKLRKYASLLPILKQSGKTVALVGSVYSNHVLSLLQLLRQEGISVKLFLEEPRGKIQGNYFFLSLLLQKEEVEWGGIEHVPAELFYIPPGACMKEALPGGLTLPLDILENERKLGFAFDHIFIDAGTGMSAAALVLGMNAVLKRKTKIHIVFMRKIAWNALLQEQKEVLEGLLQERLEIQEENIRCLFPVTGKSFGSCNQTLFREIVHTAQKEGIFLDPLYTAKLLCTVKQEVSSLQGKILWIHSGGALSLTGFFGRLLPLCDMV